MTSDFKRFLADMSEKMNNKYCLISGCKCKRIIKAHTVQKQGGLSSIARNGLVYSFTRNSQKFINLLETDSRIRNGSSVYDTPHYWPEPDEVGKSVASTIMGFCSEHDRTIFAPIELEEFVPTIQQVRVYALRCFAYELYRKEAAAKEEIPQLTKQLSSGNGWDELIDIHHEGTVIGMQMTRSIFNELYQGLNSESKLNLDYVLFEIQDPPEIVCSFSRFINLDLKPVTHEMVEKRNFEWITCSCFCKNERGFVLFSWNHEHESPRLFVESILKNVDPGNLIANMIFLCSENVYFSPTWWDSLSTSKRIGIEKEIITLYPDIRKILSEKPRRIVEWQPTHVSNCGI